MAKARKKTSTTMKAKAIVRDERVSDPVDTGIYVTPGMMKYHSVDGMQSVLRGIAGQWDLPAMMENLERGARLIIEDFGGKVHEHESGFIDADVPADAEPVARDAASALEWIGKTRHHLQRGNAQEAAVCAYHLGRVAERVYVRKFEPMAKVGREHNEYVGGKWIKLTSLERSIVGLMRNRDAIDLHELTPQCWGEPYHVENRAKYDNALSKLNGKLIDAGVQFHIKQGEVRKSGNF